MSMNTGAVRTVPRVFGPDRGTRVPVKSHPKRRLNYVRLFMTLFTLWAVISFGGQQVAIWQETRALKAIQHQIQQVNDSNALLQKDVVLMQGKEYTEQVARERLGMTKPGEIMYIPSIPTLPQGTNLQGSSGSATPGH